MRYASATLLSYLPLKYACVRFDALLGSRCAHSAGTPACWNASNSLVLPPA
jgi:hypothetical protein